MLARLVADVSARVGGVPGALFQRERLLGKSLRLTPARLLLPEEGEHAAEPPVIAVRRSQCVGKRPALLLGLCKTSERDRRQRDAYGDRIARVAFQVRAQQLIGVGLAAQPRLDRAHPAAFP